MNDNLNDILTFVIPVRIDSEERMRNLFVVIKWLLQLHCKILVLEADVERRVKTESLDNNGLIEYSFVKDANPCFHRTRYINRLLRSARTRIVSVWDADIIIDYNNIREAVQLIVEKDMTLTYPYNGKCIMLTPVETFQFIEDINLCKWEEKKLTAVFERPNCGGAFMVDKKQYLQIGGENEHFVGWGPEDAERLRRTQIMRHQVSWTTMGNAYHLWHPRKKNSSCFDEATGIALRKEFVKVCSMDYHELQAYINTWNK